jgi:Zn finger protein HypA/HybF involved in hydrogenase expression
MKAQPMQCPNCGATLPHVNISDVIICDYCGAKLQISQGASGFPFAKLLTIEADASYLAKDRACEHLKDELLRLQGEKAQIEEKQRMEGHNVLRSCLLGLLVLGVMGAAALVSVQRFSADDSVGGIGTVMAAVALLAVCHAWELSWKKAAKKKYFPEIQRIQVRIGATSADIESLRHDMEALRKKL